MSITLGSGARAHLERDGAEWILVVDGTPQSAIDVDDPRHLSFAYIRHMGHVIDLAFPEHEPLTALHLGAGAMSIPRFIDATRPRSRQQVIELEPDIVELIRRVAPLPANASIRLRYGDARAELARLPRGLVGAVDLAVVDVFAGPQTPAHVTTVEFFEELSAFVAPDGVLLVNIADGHGMRFARGVLASLHDVFGHETVIGDPGVLKGRRFGNLTAAVTRQPRDLPGLARLTASGFPAASVLAGADVAEWLRGAAPVHDENATPSPLPGGTVFSER
ncbi:spermine synthase [Pseudoclavibacter endophyticus]|uniref:Spermine synthase n=1 Tax=Pseudoclavibacter endophyticus TaxID=1778590 RepID=A0A6H9WHP5_9MICO|nr:spermine synthase [Pseudoclavibacter endophyticus]